MNKKEIAETLGAEVWHLEAEIKKLQARCDKLKTFVRNLETEVSGPAASNQKTIFDTKFGKLIDRVFSEKPKRSKR